MKVKPNCPCCGSANILVNKQQKMIRCEHCSLETSSNSWVESVQIWNDQPVLDRAKKAEQAMKESAQLIACAIRTLRTVQTSKHSHAEYAIETAINTLKKAL